MNSHFLILAIILVTANCVLAENQEAEKVEGKVTVHYYNYEKYDHFLCK